MNKKTVLRFKTVVLSDVHLGTPECRADEVNHFLRHTQCERLILSGDIIDGWSLVRKGRVGEPAYPVRAVGAEAHGEAEHRGDLPAGQPRRPPGPGVADPPAQPPHSGRLRARCRGRALSRGARRRLRRGDPPPSLPGRPRQHRLPVVAAGEPFLQSLPRLARAGVLLAEPGNQGAGQGCGELHRKLREPAFRRWPGIAGASG